MTHAERHQVLQGWAGVGIQLASTHFLLWEHAPGYQRAVRRILEKLPRFPERTAITGRLARELSETLKRSGL